MTALQLIPFAAGLYVALFLFTHPRVIAPYLDGIAGTLSTIAPNRSRRCRAPRQFTDRSIRAMALTYALLFTVVLCGIATQLARGF